jgi:hypothetical protein
MESKTAADNPPRPKTRIGRLIHKSGCSHIQSALEDMATYGLTADNLDPKTKRTVLGVMASAGSVGGVAAPIDKKGK